MFTKANASHCTLLSISMPFSRNNINQLTHISTLTLKSDANYSAICIAAVKNISALNVHYNEACLVHKMQLYACKEHLGECLYCFLFVLVWIDFVACLMLSSYKLVTQLHVICE